jgi:hypothetical protein
MNDSNFTLNITVCILICYMFPFRHYLFPLKSERFCAHLEPRRGCGEKNILASSKISDRKPDGLFSERRASQRNLDSHIEQSFHFVFAQWGISKAYFQATLQA